MFPVTPEKAQALRDRMDRLGVREADLDERFVHAGGHGGQNVNKVATCVMLVHTPTGVSVKCQKDRSQGMNRFFARRLLCDKLEALAGGGEDPQSVRASKLKRQKQRRARRARQKAQAESAAPTKRDDESA